MSLLNEIEKLMSSVDSSINYRVVILGGKSLYLEGIKSVVSLGTEQVDFQLKKCLISICGEGLKVKYLDKTTCVIEGEISSVVTK